MFSNSVAKVVYFLCITCVWSSSKPIILECSTNLSRFQRSYGQTKQKFIVECNCHSFRISSCYVVGTDAYTPSSSICCGGLHSGAISLANNKTSMLLEIIHKKKKNFVSSSKNGIKSRSFSQHKQQYFQLLAIPSSEEAISQNNSLEITTSATVLKSITHNAIDTTFNQSMMHGHIFSTNSNLNLVFSSTVLPSQSTLNFFGELQTNTLNATSNVGVTAFPLIIGLSSAATLLILIFFVYRCRRFNCRWIVWVPRRDKSEPCVCYVATDSLSQSLLNDPETCERPCSVRLAVEELDACQSDACNDCATKYEF